MLLSELSLVRAAHIVLACSNTDRASVLGEQLQTRVRCVSPSVVGHGHVADVAKQNALEVFERSVAPFQAQHDGRPPSLVVGIDTVVSVGDHTLGKPASMGQARDMLMELAAAGTHTVTTGVTLVYGDPAGGLAPAHVQTFVEETTVELDAQAMGAAEIEAYLASGEPMDSPGGYCVRGLGAAFASSVVGEPLNAEHGFPLHRFLAEIDPTRLKAWIDAGVPEEESPAPTAVDQEEELDGTMPPGIVCEDDECGLPSD